jgi:hypothetical protein
MIHYQVHNEKCRYLYQVRYHIGTHDVFFFWCVWCVPYSYVIPKGLVDGCAGPGTTGHPEAALVTSDTVNQDRAEIKQPKPNETHFR